MYELKASKLELLYVHLTANPIVILVYWMVPLFVTPILMFQLGFDNLTVTRVWIAAFLVLAALRYLGEQDHKVFPRVTH